MTERGEGALSRTADSLTIGPSGLRWDGDTLVIEIAETTPWLRRRVKGTIRVKPEALIDRPLALGRSERHFWWPLAPCARIEVDLAEPDLSWNGCGYLDMNVGAEPIENGFSHWDWSRATLKDGRTVVLYDLKPRDGAPTSLAVQFDPHAGVQEIELPAPAKLRPTLWMMDRRTRADAGSRVRVHRTYEDTPFYSRSALSTQLFGERVEAMHESLSLDRLRSPLVQFMLPYRMPREGARAGPRVPWPIRWRPAAP